jgi:hypothetical protein
MVKSVGKFSNSRKKKFIEDLPSTGITSTDIISRCKFNFSFLDSSQEYGSSFSELSNDELILLIDKIKLYSRDSLRYWQNNRVGGGGHKVLEVYGAFPKSSEFKFPKSVPHDVLWARFRMDGAGRLVGFLIPAEFSRVVSADREFFYDTNTFYVVFIDLEHKFYKL